MNQLDSLTIHDLRVISTMGELLHFGQTADAIEVSQPTISASVAKVESCLGYPLFHRTSRKCKTTPRGQEVIQIANQILQDLDVLQRDRAGKPLTGTLRVGLIPTIAPYLLPFLYQTIATLFPKVDLIINETITEQLIQQLEHHELDLAITSSVKTKGNIVQRIAFEENLVLAVPTLHPLSEYEQVPLRFLAQQDMLLLEKGHCLRDQALILCQPDAGTERQSCAASIQTLLLMVNSSLGYTILPEFAVHSVAVPDGVCLRPIAESIATRPVVVNSGKWDRRDSHFERIAEVLGQFRL